jgi:UDP-GlcNAc3NAcA epimerase
VSPFITIGEIIVHTGQHYDDEMSAIFFRELEIPKPNYNLNIGSGSHGRQTGQMLAAIEEVLLKEKPDWILIYGDTNSTLAGALAAAKLHIPIAHVEAGLRSFNRLMPEEINRIVADQLSHLLLCPSQTAVNNLAAEGIGKNEGQRPFINGEILGNCEAIHKVSTFISKVVITGDVMFDALQFAATKAAAHSDILARLQLQPQGYLLATVHRAENTDNSQRLTDILSAFAALNEPVVFPVHPRTRNYLQKSGYQPPQNVRLIDPVGYFDIIALEKSARMLLTDSGGMQKEAYWLKVPCITLRDETEWVETVDNCWNILAGAEHNRIIEAVRTFKTPTEHLPLYGDGQAAEKILDALCQESLNL